MLRGKKALVTGGTRGIGRAIAKAFVKNGAQVVITGREDASLREACRDLGECVSCLQWDAADAEIAETKLLEAVHMLGGLDILVNNAGVLVQTDYEKRFFDLSPAEWDATMNANLRSVYFVSQAAARYMTRAGVHGHILNVCSEMAFQPAFTAYGVSKWGVRGLTEGLGLLLGPMGITVNGIAPGPTTTDMMHWKEGQSMARPKHPNGRWGTPEELAELAVFLTCGKGDNIVGQCVVSDGGHVLIGRGQGAI